MNQKYAVAYTIGLSKDVIMCIKAGTINISSFIVNYKNAPIIKITTITELPLLLVAYGFFDKCYDQQYLPKELFSVFIPMQLGDADPQELDKCKDILSLPSNYFSLLECNAE